MEEEACPAEFIELTAEALRRAGKPEILILRTFSGAKEIAFVPQSSTFHH